MALDLKNLSFSRQILPVAALLGLIAAAIFILAGMPDRDLSEPVSYTHLTLPTKCWV